MFVRAKQLFLLFKNLKKRCISYSNYFIQLSVVGYFFFAEGKEKEKEKERKSLNGVTGLRG